MKKRVVLLSAFLSPHRSGAEAMVEEVSTRLKDDFDIMIVTGKYSARAKRHDTLRGIAVRRIGLGLPIDKYLFPFLAPLAARGLQPDILHAVLESYAGFALILCRFTVPKAKRILTLQSTNTTLLLGPMHQSADRITAISNALIERAKTFGRTDVVLIPNGIDLAGIRKACRAHPKDSGRVLFVGRLEPMKGVDTLLKAFAKAIQGLSPDVHLRIVGDGSLMNSLKALASELDINHRVMFAGRRGPDAVLDEFARAEIFCGLSRSEALGNVFLEAQAAGCAVLATNVGGIPEIVKDGTSGILVQSDDIDAAASSLRDLLKDPAKRAALAREGRMSSQRYDWNAIAKRYAEMYTSL